MPDQKQRVGAGRFFVQQDATRGAAPPPAAPAAGKDTYSAPDYTPTASPPGQDCEVVQDDDIQVGAGPRQRARLAGQGVATAGRAAAPGCRAEVGKTWIDDERVELYRQTPTRLLCLITPLPQKFSRVTASMARQSALPSSLWGLDRSKIGSSAGANVAESRGGAGEASGKEGERAQPGGELPAQQEEKTLACLGQPAGQSRVCRAECFTSRQGSFRCKQPV